MLLAKTSRRWSHAAGKSHFESLIGELLQLAGLEGIEVTRRERDGGIDVRAILVIGGLSRITTAAQVKRWRRSVPIEVARELCGALSVHEQGLTVTTLKFTRDATAEATAPGCGPAHRQGAGSLRRRSGRATGDGDERGFQRANAGRTAGQTQATLLEGLQTGIVQTLAPLGDVVLTGTGQSSSELLGVPTTVLAERLADYLVREIMLRGSRGGPLAPLADQLNHDVTHLQGQRLEGMLARLANEVQDALAQAARTWSNAMTNQPVRLLPRPAFLVGREELLVDLDTRLTGGDGQGP